MSGRRAFPIYRWAAVPAAPRIDFADLSDALAAAAKADDRPDDARRVSVATEISPGQPYEVQLQTRGGAMFYLVAQ